jgi:hypothetical protein
MAFTNKHNVMEKETLDTDQERTIDGVTKTIEHIVISTKTTATETEQELTVS